MGFALTVLYFFTFFLTPAVLFGPLAVLHIEVILAILIFTLSLPKLPGSIILKTPQSLALIGLAFSALMSVLIGQHWAGGSIQAFLEFLPTVFAYFIVCLHCNSKRKLQVLVVMMLFVCLFVIAQGCTDLLHGVPADGPSISEASDSDNLQLWNMEHPYLFVMKSDAGVWFYRLMGQGLFHDPNDFGQLIVCVIPLVFIFWRAKKTLRNTACVVLPVCVLLFGLYLTHSRGGLVALMVVLIVASRRRIGTLPALLLAGGLLVAAMALHFTGGREISAESGSDRTELWSQSLQLLKSHPLFGVGSGMLSDFLGHTAHNSVMVCAAELGLFGLYFWSLFLFSTVRDALETASPDKVTQGEPIAAVDELFPGVASKTEEIDKAEINRMGRLMVLSLTGFLAAGWFLSRAFVMTLFLLGGMAEVVYEMAVQRGMIGPRLRLARVLPYSGGLAISLILVMYIAVRILHLMH